MILNKKITAYLSLAILIVLTVLPVFILYSNVPISRVLWPWTTLFYTLGKLTGLVGLAAFSFALFLSSRFVWLDRLFDGLPKVINIHRWLGTISFTLIILHPLFLAFRLLPVSHQGPLSLFLYWTQAAYIFGYISILIFMFFVVMTFFWRMKYERLKSLHSLLAVPLMIGGVHALLIDSDVKRMAALGWYYIILITISTLVYLFRLFLIEYRIKARPFIIDGVEYPSANTIKVILKPSKKAIDFKAGQFLFVSFDSINKNEEHPFSVSAIYPDGRIAIIAKILGDYTANMRDLKAGNRAFVDGPYGTFGTDINNKGNQVWIAGGIGITPFISMAESFTSCPTPDGQVNAFYVVASEDDLAEADYLRQMESNCPNFKLTTYVSGNQGRFDMDKLRSFVRDFQNYEFFICGPAGMIEYFVASLRKENIPKNRINIEAFKLL